MYVYLRSNQAGNVVPFPPIPKFSTWDNERKKQQAKIPIIVRHEMKKYLRKIEICFLRLSCVIIEKRKDGLEKLAFDLPDVLSLH